jgi:hypothetical protein
MKYRETRPQSVEPLCAVLECTYDELQHLADNLISTDATIQRLANELSCAVQLLHCCLEYGFIMRLVTAI